MTNTKRDAAYYMQQIIKNNIAQTSLMATVTNINDDGTIDVDAVITDDEETGTMEVPFVPVLKLGNIEPEIKVGDIGLCLIEYDLHERDYLYNNLIYLGKVGNLSPEKQTSTPENIKIKNLHTAMEMLIKSWEQDAPAIHATHTATTIPLIKKLIEIK